MTTVHDHERYQDDAGAYLLGALNDLEAQAFEAHMTHCPTCREEVDRLRVAADSLPRAVEQLEPPASLKRRLMETIRREAAEVRRAEAPPGAGARVREWLSHLGGARPGIAWAAAALVLIVGMLAGYAITKVSSGGGTRTVAAKVDRGRLPEGSASLVLPSGDKNAILRVNGLRVPAGNRVYEVWVIRGRQAIPVSLFNVTTDGSGAAAIPEDLHEGDLVGVTRERVGGARAPSERPVIAVKV